MRNFQFCYKNVYEANIPSMQSPTEQRWIIMIVFCCNQPSLIQVIYFNLSINFVI